MKRIGCQLRPVVCAAALAFAALWPAGCVTGTMGHSAGTPSPHSTNPVVTATKHISLCFVTPERASALLGATVSVVLHTQTECKYTDGPAQSPNTINIEVYSSWEALNPPGSPPLDRSHPIQALGGFSHAYSKTVSQGPQGQGNAFASLPGGKWLNVYVTSSSLSGLGLRSAAEDILRLAMRDFATKDGAPSGSRGTSANWSIQALMTKLGCTQQDVKPAGDNPLTDGTNMTEVATCFFPFNDETGGTEINVFMFGSASEASRWVNTGAFTSIVGHSESYIVLSGNAVASVLGGESALATAMAAKIGHATVSHHHGSSSGF